MLQQLEQLLLATIPYVEDYYNGEHRERNNRTDDTCRIYRVRYDFIRDQDSGRTSDNSSDIRSPFRIIAGCIIIRAERRTRLSRQAVGAT